jgi:hypothetical protein
VILIAMLVIHVIAVTLTPAPEIALTIGEPWEDMRQRSTARIGEALPGELWFGMPETDASLRFIHPLYGFTTPPARFFTVGFKNENVRNVRMSPQVEPLDIDDVLKLVTNIESQLVDGGWVNMFPESDPSFGDTPEQRAVLRNAPNGLATYWQAGDAYQVMLVLHRFKVSKRPHEERYLLSLDLAAPWIPQEDKTSMLLQPDASGK